MVLSAGARLGSYEILAPLGAGGMGEVYRARDTRLDRSVAIKVLPSHLSSNPDLRERFEREARAIAALNHPHICVLHDIGQQDGVSFLVMEYLDGQTLAQRLVKGALPLDPALRIGIEIADALDKAHRRGIVHRDLKPGNIIVTKSGAKLLDFGLAKSSASPDGGDDSMLQTASPSLTAQGIILGTLQYMAPEQLEGKDADARTDIFAFGAVLYETITGRKAFEGKSNASLISAIMSAEPKPLSTTEPLAPPMLDHIIKRCLAKDPDERWQAASDVMRELRWTAENRAQASVPGTMASRRTRKVWIVAAALLAGVVFAGGALWTSLRPRPELQWTGERLGGSAVAFGPRVSPDGQMLAFQAMVEGATQVAVMKPQSGNWTVLTKDRSRGIVSWIAWSPDGTKLFFDRMVDAPRGIFDVPLLGGEERLVLEDAMGPEPLPDGTMVVTRINAEGVPQLYRFWPETGRLLALPALPAESLVSPAARAFPDGREVVFFGRTPEAAETADHLYVVDLESLRTRRLGPDVAISFAAWFPLATTSGGRVLFDLPAGNLHRIVAVPRDGSDKIRVLVTLTEKPLWIDTDRDGSLYVDQLDQGIELVRFAPDSGAVERVQLPDNFREWALPLPDGRVLLTGRMVGRDRILSIAPGKDPVPFLATEEEGTGPLAMVGESAFAFLLGTVPARSLALASVADGRILRRFTRVDGAGIQAVAGSPDGKTVYYAAAGMVWAVPAEDGEPQKVRAGNGVAIDPGGRNLYIQVNEPTSVRLIRMPVGGGKEEVVPLPTGLRLPWFPITGNAVGPDGRIAARVAPLDSWFWYAVVFDPSTGRVQSVPGGSADMTAVGWTNDGQVVLMAQSAQGSLWRFAPESPPR